MVARSIVLAAMLLAASLSTPQQAGAQSPGERKMIAMLVYPDFTALDLVGPHQVFSGLEGYDVKLVWKNTDLVKSDSGLTLKPDLAFQDCPQQVSILFVPGGTRGTVQVMQDPEVLAFVKSRVKRQSTSPASAQDRWCSALPGCCAATRPPRTGAPPRSSRSWAPRWSSSE